MVPISEVKVLVVSGREDDSQALAALLAPTGVQVLTAATGDAALAALAAHEVALGLIDAQLPARGAAALADRVHADEATRHIPLVFVGDGPQDRPPAGAAGAVDFMLKPIDGGTLAAKVRVFADLYQQRRQLQLKNEELQRMLTLNDMVAAVLTHDMRTPMAAIVMNAEIVQLRGHEEVLQKAGARIKSSSSRLIRMIDQLLDFSRLRSGAVSLDRQAADLQALCAVAVKETTQMFPETPLHVQAEGDLGGEFDADRIGKALSSLVGNAVKFSPGTAPVTIRLDGRDAARLQVSVASAGVLPNQTLDFLMGPLPANTQGDAVGLGLGLYILDRYVRAHGGAVTGRSTDSEGTVIEFWLPRRAG
jgi:two-component system, sensor histidine kinase and response regulator